jgi:hypothetical protein
MQRHVLRRGLKQLRHLRLRHPHRLILKPALDARAPVLRLVEQEFGIGFGCVAHAGLISDRREELHLGPIQTFMAAQVFLKPGFQCREQFFALLWGQLLFNVGAVLHTTRTFRRLFEDSA